VSLVAKIERRIFVASMVVADLIGAPRRYLGRKVRGANEIYEAMIRLYPRGETWRKSK
jgi:hypothetical protein